MPMRVDVSLGVSISIDRQLVLNFSLLPNVRYVCLHSDNRYYGRCLYACAVHIDWCSKVAECIGICAGPMDLGRSQ